MSGRVVVEYNCADGVTWMETGVADKYSPRRLRATYHPEEGEPFGPWTFAEARAVPSGKGENG